MPLYLRFAFVQENFEPLPRMRQEEFERQLCVNTPRRHRWRFFGGTTQSGGNLLGGCCGFLAGFHGGGCLPAARGFWRGSGRFADEFRNENAGDEQLGPVIVEVDGGALRIRCGDDPQAVNLVLDGLPFLHYLHNFLLKTAR